MKNEQTTVLIPSGEWLSSFRQGMAFAGFEIEKKSERSLSWELKDGKLPLQFREVRASDIPRSLVETNIPVQAGFTGSDIGIESGLLAMPFPASNQDREDATVAPSVRRVWKFPTTSLVENPILPRVSLAINRKKYGEEIPVSLDRLGGTRVYTSYPQMTKSFFDRQGINAIPVDIQERPGKIEIYPTLDPECVAIVDVVNSGKTLRENDLEEAITLVQSNLFLFVMAGISSRDEGVLTQLMEAIDQSVKKIKPGRVL